MSSITYTCHSDIVPTLHYPENHATCRPSLTGINPCHRKTDECDIQKVFLGSAGHPRRIVSPVSRSKPIDPHPPISLRQMGSRSEQKPDILRAIPDHPHRRIIPYPRGPIWPAVFQIHSRIRALCGLRILHRIRRRWTAVRPLYIPIAGLTPKSQRPLKSNLERPYFFIKNSAIKLIPQSLHVDRHCPALPWLAILYMLMRFLYLVNLEIFPE